MSGPTVEQLQSTLDEGARLVQAIKEDQWPLPTPCADWDVRALVEHMIFGHRLFTQALGVAVPASNGALARDYRSSGNEMIAAFEQPGALDAVVTLPIGEVPALFALHLRITEAIVHGWDVAQAIGESARFDDDVVEEAIAFSRPALDSLPAGRTPFAPPQPTTTDAPALDRLVALLGRRPT
jgi:uncharacterized protein (TIGR03086 family)